MLGRVYKQVNADRGANQIAESFTHSPRLIENGRYGSVQSKICLRRYALPYIKWSRRYSRNRECRLMLRSL